MEPPPTDGLFRPVWVDFEDGTSNEFLAVYNVDERCWLDPLGGLLWPTRWGEALPFGSGEYPPG